MLSLTGEMMIHCDRLKDHVITSLSSCSSHLHTPLSPASPFGSHDYLSGRSPGERNKLMELLSQVENSKCCCVPVTMSHRTITADRDQLILKTTDTHISSLNDSAHKFAFDIIFIQLKTKLEEVPTMEVSYCDIGHRFCI